MGSARVPLFAALALSLSLASNPTRAADFVVPTFLYPDVQTAVAGAAISPDVDNQILISVPFIDTGSQILVMNSFGPTRRLVIRPATTVARAQILSTGAGLPIFTIQDCGYVQLQDLDIVRTVTNTTDLIHTERTTFTTIERCRIGSFGPPGPAGLSYISILYPGDGGLTIRNCIFFSSYKQAFDNGILVIGMMDNSNAVLFYNNCVADYNKVGIEVNDGTVGSLVLLRNNVVVNNTVSAPEPIAYKSGVAGGVIVVTSDNLAFASGPNVQVGAPQDIFGTAATEVPVVLPPTVLEETNCFTNMVWDATPGGANFDFYRTIAASDLHLMSSYGINVGPGLPDPHDLAVNDDFDRNIRPGGGPPYHTDRGPFQVDPGTTAVGGEPRLPAQLVVTPQRNPARSLRLHFSTGSTGVLTAEVFDAAGRRAGTLRRQVRAGESGVLEWSSVPPAGVYAYRVWLSGSGRPPIEQAGKLSVVR